MGIIYGEKYAPWLDHDSTRQLTLADAEAADQSQSLDALDVPP